MQTGAAYEEARRQFFSEAESGTPVTHLRSGAKGLGLPTPYLRLCAPVSLTLSPCSSESEPPCLRPGDPYLRLCAPVSLTLSPCSSEAAPPCLWPGDPYLEPCAPVSPRLSPRISGLETRISDFETPLSRFGEPYLGSTCSWLGALWRGARPRGGSPFFPVCNERWHLLAPIGPPACGRASPLKEGQSPSRFRRKPRGG
jgi:hypothetical protein